MPLLLYPIAIFLSGLLASALVRILAGAGVTMLFISGVNTLFQNVVSNIDMTGFNAWALTMIAKLGVIQAFEIELGALFFALTIKSFTSFARFNPS